MTAVCWHSRSWAHQADLKAAQRHLLGAAKSDFAALSAFSELTYSERACVLAGSVGVSGSKGQWLLFWRYMWMPEGLGKAWVGNGGSRAVVCVTGLMLNPQCALSQPSPAGVLDCGDLTHFHGFYFQR